MNKNFIKIIKQISVLLFLILSLNSCVYMNIDGSTSFNRLVDSMVQKTVQKLNQELYLTDTVLVSDFVNIDKLENRSRLGFLLSATLKDRLLANNITVKEIELRKHFALGENGFNVLSRDTNDINTKIDNARYAFVGTYSITTKTLIVFIKLIDLQTGNIILSSQESTFITDEILDLEKTNRMQQIYTPIVL
ncbi:hypothetical protein AMOL_2690 [Malaciobacter molluscorum LMG 25693]|uniref:FlgO domain-containing protein n=2 Tax=Malaciobacter molluscorum LMG 25693 TaxID=870501 RepID=A0AB33GVU3_9BACT|nr:FlgO family outer membrane protein [Malaciobacter molluscorum]AXX93628.1 hypothetical protein AMOL_2690 [Malaciobacter molluscorum LMG 25693]